jgi:tetratricopeptide (TPR) repeat protein
VVILSQQYKEPAARAQSVASDIAQDAARHLRVTLTGDDERAVAKSGTTNSEAYQLYWRTLLSQRRVDVHLRDPPARIDRSLERSRKRDPGCARDRSPLSADQGGNRVHRVLPRHQYDEAIRGFRDAIALDPSDVVAFWGLGKALNQKQQYQETVVALDLLDQAFSVRSGMLIALPREPVWDAIRDEPRFKDLLKRVGV